MKSSSLDHVSKNTFVDDEMKAIEGNMKARLDVIGQGLDFMKYLLRKYDRKANERQRGCLGR